MLKLLETISVGLNLEAFSTAVSCIGYRYKQVLITSSISFNTQKLLGVVCTHFTFNESPHPLCI